VSPPPNSTVRGALLCCEFTGVFFRSSLTSLNLYGYALPIKQLKGTEPVESLDLSSKGLGVSSAIVIASLIGVNASPDFSTAKLWGLLRCASSVLGAHSSRSRRHVLG
jgi:hypothetical protein